MSFTGPLPTPPGGGAGVAPAPTYYCTRCGEVAERKFYRSGSIALGIFLCLLVLVPGIIYFIWMGSTKYYGCPKCGAKEVVPLDSPVARRALGTM